MNPEPLTNHLEALKKALFRVFLLILLGVVAAFSFSQEIVHFLTSPMQGEKLVLFSPLEGFEVAFWTSLVFGALGTLPLWIVPCLKFILPALTEREKESLFPVALFSGLFLMAGLISAHFYFLPFMNHSLYAFNESYGTNMWGLKSYIDYVLGIYFANALLFEILFVLLFLTHKGILDYPMLKNKRKGVYLFSLIIGAILTPPDIASQLLVAVPLMGIYEIALLYAKCSLRPVYDMN